MNTRNT